MVANSRGLGRELISIVDDDDAVREAVKSLLQSHGLEANAFASGLDFLGSSSLDDTACLIADVNMPVLSGVELFERLKRAGRSIPTILITAYPDDTAHARALASGVVCYLAKPFEEAELMRCLRAALAD